MPRPLASRIVLATAALIAAAGAAAAQSYTTRIEPRPFYGATVTLEEGVRVIRPLPPERHVIINPNNTPLSLGFNETRVYENRVIRHHYEGGRYSRRSGGGVAYGYLGGGGGYGYGYGARGYGHGFGKNKGGFGYGRGFGLRRAPRFGVH